MYWTVTRKVKNLNQVNAWIIYQNKSTFISFTLISFEKVFYNSKMESWKHEIEVVVHTTERLNKRVNWIMSYLHISSNVCIKRNKSYFLFYNPNIFMKKKKEFTFHFWTIRLKRLNYGKWSYNCVAIVRVNERSNFNFFFSDHSK